MIAWYSPWRWAYPRRCSVRKAKQYTALSGRFCRTLTPWVKSRSIENAVKTQWKMKNNSLTWSLWCSYTFTKVLHFRRRITLEYQIPHGESVKIEWAVFFRYSLWVAQKIKCPEVHSLLHDFKILQIGTICFKLGQCGPILKNTYQPARYVCVVCCIGNETRW